MKTLCRVVLLLVASMFLPACNGHDVSAVAKCGGAQGFSSRLGVLNVGQFGLGTVFLVNTETKTAFKLGDVTGPATTEPEIETVKAKVNTKLKIEFLAEVPEAVKVGLTTLITNSTDLVVAKMQRKNLTDPIEKVNANANIEQEFLKIPAPKKGKYIVYVVHSVMAAQSVKLSLEGGVDSALNVSVFKYGEYKLTVTYNCKEMFESTTAGDSRANMFFKATPLAYDATKKFYLDPSVEVDLGEYNLIPALH